MSSTRTREDDSGGGCLPPGTTCFVCLEQCPHVVVCDCLHMPCHAVCQQRVVNSKGTATCGVCLSPYTNVEQRLRRRTLNLGDVVLFVTCVVMVAGSGVLFWMYALYPTMYFLFVEAFGLFSGGVILAWYWVVVLWRPVVYLRVKEATPVE